MNTRFCLAIAVSPLLAACSGALGGSEPDPSRSPPPPAAARSQPIPPLPAEAPPPEHPPAAASLTVAVEGRCSGLDVGFIGATTFVRHGHVAAVGETPAALVLARVTDRGIEDDPTLARGVRLGEETWRSMHVLSMSGTWPDDAHLTMFNEGGERVGTLLMEYAWKGDRWRLVPPRPPQEDAYGIQTPWQNGSTLWLHESTYPEFAVLPRGAAPRPDFGALRVRNEPSGCFFEHGATLARPGGEVLLAGRYCGIFPSHQGSLMTGGMVGEAALARWVPGRPAVLEPIPPVARRAALRLTGLREAAPSTVYLFGSIVNADESAAETYIARSDGAGWTRVPAPFKHARSYSPDADGTLWAWADGAIFRLPAGGEWEKAPIENVTDVAWKDERPVWAMTKDSLHRRDASGAWTDVAVPKPAFSEGAALRLDALRLSPNGDLWVRASYAEKRAQWTKPEEREALLRFGAPLPASRCEAGAPGDRSLLAGWPEQATESCTTPFAVLVRVSKSAPATYDYPQTRAALKGHTELEGAEFVDIDLGGRRYFGAKATSLAQGRAAVELVGKKVDGSRPELVCLAPHVTRTLPIDVATGAIAAAKPTAQR